MINKNSVDGIQKRKKAEIKRVHYVKVVSSVVSQKRSWLRNWTQIFYNRKFALVIAVVGAFAIFVSGMWVEFSTHRTLADVVGPQTATPPGIAANFGNFPSTSVSNIPSDEFYNLSLDQIESYLQAAFKTPESLEADRLALRTQKLTQYLKEKNSPLAEIANTLAGLRHWQMVLAISNSESSLGKRCYNNNCSGIGVEPGHPLWREYETKAQWAVDLDRLIEKRYLGWTLDDMNGVYNKPGSENWLLASKTILEELQERGIE